MIKGVAVVFGLVAIVLTIAFGAVILRWLAEKYMDFQDRWNERKRRRNEERWWRDKGPDSP